MSNKFKRKSVSYDNAKNETKQNKKNTVDTDLLWKTQHTTELNYFEVAEDRSYSSVQSNVFSHVLFSILT